MPRSQRLFLQDIKESAAAIFDYTQGLDFQGFTQDRKTYSAVIREFEIIGEAVKHLPPETINSYTQVHWRDIKDFRNLLIHEYFGVDFEIVWNTIWQDLPVLQKVVDQMICNYSTE